MKCARTAVSRLANFFGFVPRNVSPLTFREPRSRFACVKGAVPHLCLVKKSPILTLGNGFTGRKSL